jgi:hypothetical protein
LTTLIDRETRDGADDKDSNGKFIQYLDRSITPEVRTRLKGFHAQVKEAIANADGLAYYNLILKAVKSISSVNAQSLHATYLQIRWDQQREDVYVFAERFGNAYEEVLCQYDVRYVRYT